MTDDGFLDRPLRARDAATLEVVTGLLHDEWFELSAIRFDEIDGTATIPVRRLFHSGPERRVRAGILFKTCEKDWMRSLVTIRRVGAWEALRDQGIDSYSINSWHYTDRVLQVKCSQVMILQFQVNDLDVEVVDIGFAGKGRITRGPFGMECGFHPHRVYE